MQTTEELIALGKQGDRDALGELIGRHYASSYRIARGLLKNPDDAQDAVQVAYFTAIRRLDQFRGEASFKTWIGRIVVNCCLLQMRRGKRASQFVRLDEHRSHAPTPERAAWGAELSCAFSMALAGLPKALRDVYMATEESEMSQAEVASFLGLTVSATKTRLFRARARLRSTLEPVWSTARASKG